MAELLLELFSEEIPARMQPKACRDLERLMAERLAEARLEFSEMKAYATPRRLALAIDGLPERQPDLTEERRGPRVDAPEKAVQGFKGSLPAGAGVEEREEKKGTFLYAVIARKGRAAAEVLSEILPEIIRSFSWPKSMRWGEGDLRWVRPLQAILCVFDGRTVPVAIDGIEVGATTRGHRFLAPEPFEVTGFADYKDKLKKAKVVLDPEARAGRIREKAKKLAREAGLELPEDAAMIAENAGLTEWPYPLLGRFDPAFLEVPEEALVSAMRNHQKYLPLRDPRTGRLAPAFICVANTQPPDKGRAITAGNERVLSARLADARFFWQQDLKRPLEERAEDLKGIVFHEKLGTLAERVERIEALAAHIASTVIPGLVPGIHDDGPVSMDPGNKSRDDNEKEAFIARVRRAARLAKADLTTEMVGEFPELQGIMGRYIALEQGEDVAVANAVAEHYAPKGPEDACPSDPVSVCVALAEKIDTLVGFFAIDEKPTGSKDPYALRRAALGVIRLIVENGLRVRLIHLCGATAQQYPDGLLAEAGRSLGDFFAERLKVQQRETGVRHDLIDAVFSLGGEDDLVRLLARVTALQRFVETEDGANLLAGYKRAANILRIEEKKDTASYAEAAPDPKLFAQDEERRLYEALGAAEGEAKAALELEDFADAMRALARLRAPIDAFFDHVTVNADDPDLRKNRLALLARIRAAADTVADFSKIEG